MENSELAPTARGSSTTPSPADQAEMNELLASIEPAEHQPPSDMSLGPSQPLQVPSSSSATRMALPSPDPAEETDRRKPTSTSTPRRTPRPVSNSSGDSSSRALSFSAPIIPAHSRNEPHTLSPGRPDLSLALDLPNDLDALAAELLRVGATSPSTPLTPRDNVPTSGATEVLADRASFLPPLRSPTTKALPPLVHQPSSPGGRRSTMLQKQASLSLLGSSPSRPSEVDPIIGSQRSPRVQLQAVSQSRRRLTIGTHEISPHALDRLGVNTDILKKEKGMKKLGISDVDIERSEEIRRYSGVPHSTQPVTKVEFMFGFTKEQLLRVKAINRLGTSEEEVQDDYSRRVSRLGMHDTSIMQN